MELMYIACITVLGVVCYLQGETIKEQRKVIDEQARAIARQNRAMDCLSNHITKENRAKMEFQRTLADYPTVEAVIRKVQCLEAQVDFLQQRLLDWRANKNVCGKN